MAAISKFLHLKRDNTVASEIFYLQEWAARFPDREGLMEEVAEALKESFEEIRQITHNYHHDSAKQSFSDSEAEYIHSMSAAEIMLASSLGLTLSRYPTVKSFLCNFQVFPSEAVTGLHAILY